MNTSIYISIFINIIFYFSSMSVVLNSSATVVLEDIFKGLARRRPGPRTAALVAKLTAAILGFVSLGALFVVDRLGGVLSVSVKIYFPSHLLIDIYILFIIIRLLRHYQLSLPVVHSVCFLLVCYGHGQRLLGL